MDWTLLANFGIAGVMLAWFMFTVEPRLKDIAGAIDRITRAILVLTVAIDSSEAVKKQTAIVNKELDSAEQNRLK